MKESTHIYALLKANWKHQGLHMVRIENTAMSGLPDVNLCYDGFESWIETKLETKPGEFSLRPAQKVWFINRLKAGAYNTYVLSRWEDRLSLWTPRFGNELWWYCEARYHKPFDWHGLFHRVIRDEDGV